LVSIPAICLGLLFIWRNKKIAVRLRQAERGRSAGDAANVPAWMRAYVCLFGLGFVVAGLGFWLQ
jgi:hypothetical protein